MMRTIFVKERLYILLIKESEKNESQENHLPEINEINIMDIFFAKREKCKESSLMKKQICDQSSVEIGEKDCNQSY